MIQQKQVARPILLVGALIGFGVGPALAAEMPSLEPAPASSLYVMPTISGLDVDTDWQTRRRGIGVGLSMGEVWNKDFDFQGSVRLGGNNNDGRQYRQLSLGADALYMFERSDFRPFVLIGGGYAHDRMRGPVGGNPNFRVDDNALYGNAGLGFQYQLTRQFFLQLDAREVVGVTHRYNDLQMRYNKTAVASFGLSYQFGGPAVAAARPQRVSLPEPVIAPVPKPVPVPQPVVQPAPIVKPAPKIERITLSATELFDFDSAELKRPQDRLDAFAKSVRDNSQVEAVVVSGYTDRLGSHRYNQKLSQSRADAVKNYLIAHGVDAHVLTATGRGEADPVVECSQPQRAELILCLEPNRRVEIGPVTVERTVQ